MWHKWQMIFVLVLGATSVAEARRNFLRDLGRSNNLAEQRVPTEIRDNQMSNQFSERIDIQEWSSEFSSLGNRRSSLAEQQSAVSTEALEQPEYAVTRSRISTEPDELEMTQIRNWNTLRDNVMSHQFSNTELRTPEGRMMQEAIDQMSLRDINRFQAARNHTDEGIPIIEAGDDQPVSFMGEAASDTSPTPPLTRPASVEDLGTAARSQWFGDGERRTTTRRVEGGAEARVTTEVRILGPADTAE